MASETDTRSPSPEHAERKRHSDSDNELSDRKKSHFNADGSFYFKILVPSVAAGAIIGKGGETIAQMQKEFNTKIKMSKANDFYPGTTERVCLIKGSLDGILAMLNFIMEKIREKPDPNAKPAMDFDSKTPAERDKQVKILVPNSTAGMIIGKGGGYIKQIKEESGAYLQISQKAKDQALQERCITVIGEMENNKKACQMILAKIAEDPQSGSCLNVSYADVTGPVANFNPTGSPYAQNGTGSNTPAYPPVHSSHSNGHGSTYTGLGVNLNIGLGFQPPNASLLGQVLDHVRSSLRSAGYVDLVSAEIVNAITTLATYGMLGVGVGFNGSAVSESSQSWVNSSHAPEPGIASSSPGPFGPIGSSPHRYSEASYDPFRRAFNNPLPLNNNSFGLGSPQSPPIGPEHLHNEIVNSSPRSEPTRAEMQVGEHIVGAILGPGGKALLEIQHFSGANIQISKKGVYAPGTRNRWVTIYGTPNAISTAQYLIEQRISEEEAKRARNNHSSLNSSTHFSSPPSAAVLH